VDGARSSIVRVDGLQSIQRLPEFTLSLSVEHLFKARAYFVNAEARRQKNKGSGVIKVPILSEGPRVDGLLDDWSQADWAPIDQSGTAAYFDSQNKPYDVRGALAVSPDRLFAAFRVGDPDLLRNSGESPSALFKTGGALDLMLGVNSQADPTRSGPVPGDLRLLVTRVKGQTAAMLYRAVVPGTTRPAPFSSPWRTVTLDEVKDVSSEVEFATTNGNYEVSIPLATLGLKPAPDQSIKGDLGILRGNGFQTLQRIYWSNKATGITADLPSEAELTPALWGQLSFQVPRATSTAR
jgi:hypothetical protein